MGLSFGHRRNAAAMPLHTRQGGGDGTNLANHARNDAFYRMVEHARELDADAIIAMRYDATEFAPGIQEVLAYGTAVKLAKV